MKLLIQIWSEIHQSSKCWVHSLINSRTSNYICLWGLFFTCLYKSFEKFRFLPTEVLGRIWFCKVDKKVTAVILARAPSLERMLENISFNIIWKIVAVHFYSEYIYCSWATHLMNDGPTQGQGHELDDLRRSLATIPWFYENGN